MSTENIRADTQGTQLVVNIAQDTIQVLVHLNESSDIYARQVHTFNYFLAGALASILLAVCHAPDMFADRCRQTFKDAVRLLKNNSRREQLSRRLWRSIRGTINRALSLQSPIAQGGNQVTRGMSRLDESSVTRQGQVAARDDETSWPRSGMPGDINVDDSMDDMFGLETDLLNLFSAFEQDNVLRGQFNGVFQEQDTESGTIVQGDDSNRFNGIF
ncbi:hypothetical protein ACHAPU_006269 [Fusarium lateritium]